MFYRKQLQGTTTYMYVCLGKNLSRKTCFKKYEQPKLVINFY